MGWSPSITRRQNQADVWDVITRSHTYTAHMCTVRPPKSNKRKESRAGSLLQDVSHSKVFPSTRLSQVLQK